MKTEEVYAEQIINVRNSLKLRLTDIDTYCEQALSSLTSLYVNENITKKEHSLISGRITLKYETLKNHEIDQASKVINTLNKSIEK